MDIFDIKDKIIANEFFLQSVLNTYFKTNPLGFMDVGARGGSHSLVEPLHTHVSFLGFEPDLEECEQLNANRQLKNYWNQFQVLPQALGHAHEERVLNIISAATNSSLLEPNKVFVDRYNMAQKWSIAKTFSLTTVPLDDVIYTQGLGFPHSGEMIKLDTQGTEYEILAGAKQLLNDRTVCVVTEVEFFEMYKGQKLFSDIDRLLRESGFAFYGFITQHTRSKKTLNKKTHMSRERLFYADAVFFKDPLSSSIQLTERQNYVLIMAAILTGYFDFAAELVVSKRLNLSAPEQQHLTQLIQTLAYVDPLQTHGQLDALCQKIQNNAENTNIYLGKFMDAINFPDFEDVANS